MAKRLNDTAAIAARPPGHGVSHTVSCREIENGYVTEVCENNQGTGKYLRKEIFSKNPPDIQPPRVRAVEGRASLGDAVDYLKSEPSGASR
jgi:hypothetical protein